MPTVLITGSSRGLGLEFARQYSDLKWKVIATCRNIERATELKNISGDIHIYQMDIGSEQEILRTSKQLEGTEIDVLINNAAVHGPKDNSASFGNLNSQKWSDTFKINTIGPLKVTEAFLNNVKKSVEKKIVFLSSRGGSISERGKLPHHKPGGSYIYRSCKAALNAATQSLGFDLKDEGVSIVSLHPGYVTTDMSNVDTGLDAQTSVSGMIQVISRATTLENDKFFTFEGELIPW